MEQSSYDSASTLSQMMISTAHATVEATYQSDWGRIVATLIRSFGDFDVAGHRFTDLHGISPQLLEVVEMAHGLAYPARERDYDLFSPAWPFLVVVLPR